MGRPKKRRREGDECEESGVGFFSGNESGEVGNSTVDFSTMNPVSDFVTPNNNDSIWLGGASMDFDGLDFSSLLHPTTANHAPPP